MLPAPLALRLPALRQSRPALGLLLSASLLRLSRLSFRHNIPILQAVYIYLLYWLIYGKDVAEVIADNCSYKAILKASEPTTQEWCSKLVGTYDKKKVSSNYNADIMGVGKGQGTSSSTEEKRIIKPEEFAYLQDVVCVFPNGYKRLQKANYYEDSTFTSKM